MAVGARFATAAIAGERFIARDHRSRGALLLDIARDIVRCCRTASEASPGRCATASCPNCADERMGRPRPARGSHKQARNGRAATTAGRVIRRCQRDEGVAIDAAQSNVRTCAWHRVANRRHDSGRRGPGSAQERLADLVARHRTMLRAQTRARKSSDDNRAKMLAVVSLQRADRSWELDEPFARAIGQPLDKLRVAQAASSSRA